MFSQYMIQTEYRHIPNFCKIRLTKVRLVPTIMKIFHSNVPMKHAGHDDLEATTFQSNVLEASHCIIVVFFPFITFDTSLLYT